MLKKKHMKNMVWKFIRVWMVKCIKELYILVYFVDITYEPMKPFLRGFGHKAHGRSNITSIFTDLMGISKFDLA